MHDAERFVGYERMAVLEIGDANFTVQANGIISN